MFITRIRPLITNDASHPLVEYFSKVNIVAEAEGINWIKNRAGQFLLKAFDDTIEMFQLDFYAGKLILFQPKDCVGNIILNHREWLNGSILNGLSKKSSTHPIR